MNRQRFSTAALTLLLLLSAAPVVGQSHNSRTAASRQSAEAPAPRAFFANLQVPFGQNSTLASPSVLVAGATVQAYIAVISSRRDRETIELRLTLPTDVQLAQPHPDFEQSANTLVATPTLRTENDIWFRIVNLQIAEQPQHHTGRFLLSLISATEQTRHELPFTIYSAAELRQAISLEDWIMPADREGRPRKGIASNVLMPENAGAGLLRLFGSDYAEMHEPAGRVKLQLRNNLETACAVSIEYAVIMADSAQSVRWLDNLGDEAGLAECAIISSTVLPGAASSELLLNLNLNNEPALPGQYRQRLRLRLYGTDLMLHELEQPLYVRSISAATLGFSLASLLLAVIALIGLLFYGRWLFRGMTVADVVLIALFAACAFALIVIPDTVLSNLVRAALGPFSFIITGIFSEVVFYMLLTALVLLVPRRGVAAGFVFVKFLLAAILMGNLSILSAIWFPMRALVLELACYFSGLYERDGVHGQVSSGITRVWTGKVLWAALVLALADALLAACSFHLMMLFYRLFYAGWYVSANVFISGFVYTFVAIPLGVALGRRLRLVTED